jgi:hypothetical protein
MHCPPGKELHINNSANQFYGDITSDAIQCTSSPPVTNLYGYCLCLVHKQNIGALQLLFQHRYGNDYTTIAREILRFLIDDREVKIGYSHGFAVGFETLEDAETCQTSLLYAFNLFYPVVGRRDNLDALVFSQLSDLVVILQYLFSSSTINLSPTCSLGVLNKLLTNDSEFFKGPQEEAIFPLGHYVGEGDTVVKDVVLNLPLLATSSFHSIGLCSLLLH